MVEIIENLFIWLYRVLGAKRVELNPTLAFVDISRLLLDTSVRLWHCVSTTEELDMF